MPATKFVILAVVCATALVGTLCVGFFRRRKGFHLPSGPLDALPPGSHSESYWKTARPHARQQQRRRGLDCNASDATLNLLRETWCESVMGPGCPWCYVPPNGTGHKVHQDWPNQVTYFKDILYFLAGDDSCLTTPFAADTARWIDTIQSNLTLGGTLLQTWASPQGQPNYYEMPRPPNTRIESPWTLGMKCWAFNYLDQKWRPDALLPRLASANLSIPTFVAAYEQAIPLTFDLCRKVMANCFVNASYDPARNGTCPSSIADFKAGWEWQNLQHGEVLHYPF